MSPSLPRLLLEDADELLADPLPLLLGLGHAREPCEEALLRLRRGRAGRRSGRRRSRRPARPRPCAASRGRRTRRSADRRPPGARAAPRRRCRRRPRARRARARRRRGRGSAPTCSSITAAGVHVGRYAGDAVEEVLEHLLAVRRVHDLGVELDAVEAPRDVLERGDRRRAGTGDDTGAGRRRDDRVAVRHPDGLLDGQVAEQRALARPAARSCRTRPRRCGRRGRRAPAPSAASRSRCRASAPRARRWPGRRAARPRRTRMPARRTGSAPPGCAGGAPPRRRGARRARSRRAPRGRGGRSAASTARRDRPPGPAAPRGAARARARRPQLRR